MARAQLWQWLKDQGITQEEAARTLGYTLNYLNSVLTGRKPLSPAVKMRFIEEYPETAAFLLPALNGKKATSTAGAYAPADA